MRGQRLSHMTEPSEWLPVDWRNGEMLWRHLGAQALDTPFFADQFLSQNPAQRLLYGSDLASTRQLLQAGRICTPSAIIFHSSRCGSTLLMQMLACLPHCIALSEPPLLDACLQALHDGQAGPEWLALSLQALSLARLPQQQYMILKTDCWQLPELPLLRAALPQVPMYFLYREPAAVLASHQRQCGPQMIPGMLDAARLGLPPQEVSFADWPAHLLLHLLQQAQQLHHTHGLQLLNYSELPTLVWQTLLPAWGIACSPAQLQAMQGRSARHGKSLQPWQGEHLPLQAPAPALQQAYLALELLREKQNSVQKNSAKQ